MRPLRNEATTMTNALFEVIEASDKKTAIIDPVAGQFTYDDLQLATARIRDALLCDTDDLQEQRVAFLFPAGFEYTSVLLGIWAAGGVAVPLSLQHPLPELDYVIKDTGAACLLAAHQFKEVAGRLVERNPELRVLFSEDIKADSKSPKVKSEVGFDESRRAMILYTSGSTGRPKGVVTTHGNIAAQVEGLVEAWEWSSEDRILHVLPLHHIHGIINVLLCALRSGAICEFVHPFDAKLVWKRIASGDLTLFMAVPTIYTKLVAEFETADAVTQEKWSQAARAMRLHVSGSAALPVPVLESWEKMTGQRLLERYGMTEIGMGLSNPYSGERRAGFVGQPLPGVEARRTNELGEVVNDDAEAGEIEIRGGNVFLEYWQRPEETEAAFRDGWFRTGDIAIVDKGVYRILGRSSVDIIKTGGYKVSALEIEDVLRTHPEIEDCAVVGIPDDEWGERVAVCVVCPQGTTDALTLKNLRDWGKKQLASYKVPSLLWATEELPRNAMGKVQKKLVQKLFEPAEKGE